MGADEASVLAVSRVAARRPVPLPRHVSRALILFSHSSKMVLGAGYYARQEEGVCDQAPTGHLADRQSDPCCDEAPLAGPTSAAPASSLPAR